MSIKNLIFLFVICSIFSCGKTIDKPTLSDEKLARLMADCFAVDASLQSASPTERDSLQKKFYAQVFEINGVSRADYEKNVQLLTLDPTHLDSILSQTNRLLEVQKRLPKADSPQ